MEKNQDPLFFASQIEFREWLQVHYQKEQVLWVGFYKKATGIQSMTWSESVDQALCFGWIDGLRKTVDDLSYKIRFTPRRKTSIWSNVNLKKMEELISKGLVTEKGLKIYEERKPVKSGIYAYETNPHQFSEEFETRLKANAIAYQYFLQLAPGYKKTTVYWVMSAKKEETREKRFMVFLQSSEKGKRIPMLR